MLIKPLSPHLERQFVDLPKKVKFCTKCVMSNQRPRITFDKEGVCSPCRYTEMKKNNEINYEKRKIELEKLLDKYRRNDGSYDIIVPCSGGKDSSTIAHKLKHEWGMTPLCVTFSPPLYSEIGRKNLTNFINSGFDHKLITPNGKIYKLFSKLCFAYIGDHEEIFDHGQMSGPVQEALRNNVKLVMYGENGELEYGGDINTLDFRGMPWDYYDKIYFSASLDKLSKIAKEHGYFDYYKINFKEKNLDIFKLPEKKTLIENDIQFHWWGYYNKWIPQENYYYAVNNTGFEANPDGRMEGTYSKYAQLDDATDSFLYYLMYIKYGIGRTTSDAAHEVRDGHITRDEAVTLVHKFDGEFPEKSFDTFLNYLDLTSDEFWDVINRFRQDHLWEKKGNQWHLKYRVL
jgi:N-acetyl sugar amidotransferase